MRIEATKSYNCVAGDVWRNSKIYFSRKTLIGVLLIFLLFLAMVGAAEALLSDKQLLVLRPVLASCLIFSLFCYILARRTKTFLFGEIGFIYISLALAYTISPAIKILLHDFNFPIDFDGLNFAVLSPQPLELGNHFWRHVVYISGIASGYLAFRGLNFTFSQSKNHSPSDNRWVILFLYIAVGVCILIASLFLPIATTYIEHYTRFDNLTPLSRKLVEVCLLFKNGAYFVLLALMFNHYQKYKWVIFLTVTVFCIYEVVYSLGSRIVAFTILMAALGFYHYSVKPFSFKKSSLLLLFLGFVFSVIGLIRHFNFSVEDAQYNIVAKNDIRAMEFESVFCTGFHLYFERENGTLPKPDWPMFFNDVISVIPFVDHVTFNPQYWYARHYFPEAEVPPTTMGVLADSAIWGGEWDLIIRSFVNGSLLALLARWFLARRDKWWALAVYIYCFATCIMMLKYSILYQLSPLIRSLLPPLVLSQLLIKVSDFRISGFFLNRNLKDIAA